ncbi:hypothetical protein Tco_0679226, partial [Tanacetum coccineum]
NVRFAKLSSDTGRKQEAHSKGHVLDNIILSDPEVCTSRQEKLRIRRSKPTPFQTFSVWNMIGGRRNAGCDIYGSSQLHVFELLLDPLIPVPAQLMLRAHVHGRMESLYLRHLCFAIECAKFGIPVKIRGIVLLYSPLGTRNFQTQTACSYDATPQYSDDESQIVELKVNRNMKRRSVINRPDVPIGNNNGNPKNINVDLPEFSSAENQGYYPPK